MTTFPMHDPPTTGNNKTSSTGKELIDFKRSGYGILDEKDIQIDWWRFEKLEDRTSGVVKQLSQKYYSLIIQLKEPNIEPAESLRKQILTAVQEYPKLKERYERDVVEVAKRLREKKDYVKILERENQDLFDSLEVKRAEYDVLNAENERLKKLNKQWFDQAEDNAQSIKRLVQENNQLKQRIKDRIKELESSSDYEDGFGLGELQKLLKDNS